MSRGLGDVYKRQGFIERGKTRIGEKVFAVNLLQNKTTEVEIVSPHFVDPEGIKQRG